MPPKPAGHQQDRFHVIHRTRPRPRRINVLQQRGDGPPALDIFRGGDHGFHPTLSNQIPKILLRFPGHRVQERMPFTGRLKHVQLMTQPAQNFQLIAQCGGHAGL
jgi:hypothetical protein